ncbi:hypothetical protein ACQR10_09090 [Bradyrhizobium sp. HKCCYLRH2060]|uniref:hypothetical protein n=1 Tax=Bradyrhizobium TaxID=374 RepID=UPI0028E90837|nr:MULTISPECIES: hypothetical protein [unclassified Bradyrhizobium]
MPARRPHRTRLFPAAMMLLAAAGPILAGCSSINEKVGAGMGDLMPQWAGGLPADAPPRPGTPEYDRFMQERERQRQLPAAERDKQTQSNANAQATAPGR